MPPTQLLTAFQRNKIDEHVLISGKLTLDVIEQQLGVNNWEVKARLAEAVAGLTAQRLQVCSHNIALAF